MVSPSRRGGVPVFSRPRRKPSRVERLRQADRRLFADPARRNLDLADMDQAAQERAGGDDHGAGRQSPAVAEHARPATRPSAIDQVVDLALDDRRGSAVPRAASCTAAR